MRFALPRGKFRTGFALQDVAGYFPLFFQGTHFKRFTGIVYFCSVTSGSGKRPREKGCHGGGI